jgi:hypothetical protein
MVKPMAFSSSVQLSSLSPQMKSHIKIIAELFKDLTLFYYSVYSVAGNEKQIAELILSYTGDIQSVENDQWVYSHALLQEVYAENNKEDPLRSRPLRVIQMDSEEERANIEKILDTWCNISEKRSQITEEKYLSCDPSAKKIRQSLWSKLEFLNALSDLIGQYKKGRERFDSVSAVVDNKDCFQAISMSSLDKKDENAWHIDFLWTAPHNFEDNDPCPERVRGAGSALIEDALLKSIKRQKISPMSAEDKFNFAMTQKTAVTLEAVSGSVPFYPNLFFRQDKSYGYSGYRVLKGKNDLISFLNEYGGRAKIKI